MISAVDIPDRLRVRSFRAEDLQEVCLWVRTRQEMSLIGSEPGDRLTREVLRRWISRGLPLVVSAGDDGPALGFCTLSTSESIGLPSGHIELCHVVVGPASRYAPVVFRLFDAARRLADENGYCTVVGRVVPSNTRMLVVAGFKGCRRFEKIPHWAEPGFVWLQMPSGLQQLDRQRPQREYEHD